MKRNLKQLLSLLIVLAMVFSMIPSAFAADGDPATVSYVANGVAYDTVATTEGGTVVLPTLGAAPEGYTFAGWTTAEIVETTDAPAYYGGGASYAVPGDVTLYAVYSRFEEGSGGSSEYTLVTDASQLVLGVNVVIAAANADYALSTTQNGNNRASTAVTKVGDTLSITESVAELTLEAGTVPGTYAFYTGDGYLYAASSSANHLKTQATMSANASFTLTPDGSGVTSAVANGSYTRNNLRFNATNNPPLFSCYEAGKQTDIALYVKGAGGTTYYATNVVEECVHNIVNVAAVAPTCTEAGSTAGSYCDICEVVFVAVAPIAAAGHDYVGEETLAPTTTEDGVMTYTCTVCSDSYPVTIPALGEEYTVSFSVPAGVTQEAMSGYANDVIELPTPTGAPDSNAKAYVFAGWVAASVDNSDVKPEILAVGSDYLIEGNVTLYALYSYEEGGSGVTAYTLVTDAAQLSAGATVVIAAAAADYAMSTTQNSNNRGSVAVTKVDNVLSITEGVAELTLEDGTVAGTYAFYTGEGYLYAASSSSNHMRTQATINDNASFALTVDVSGVTVAIASGSNTNNNLRFNSSNNPPLFSCYASTSTMAAIALYVKDSGGTNYYTTVLDESCEHVPVERPAVAATCTEPGLTAGSYCSVCDLTLVEQTIVVPLGHDHQESDRLDPTETEAGYIEYTCPRCGNSYEVVLDPLGAPITVSFVVPEGVDAQAAAVGYAGQTTALPTPTGVPADTAQEYVFAGWTTTALEDTETRPTILPADYSYEFASDATLYALYTYSSGGSGSGDYVKVTEAPADWSGNYVIVYEAGSLILDGSLSSLDVASNYRTVTITEGVIAAAEADAYSFAVAAVEGGYSIKSAYGHFIGKASASGNSINTSTSTAYVNTLALEDGNAVITSSTMIMRYNSTNGQTRFRYYGSGQQPVALYLKQGTIGSTFYTTLPAEPAPCEHVNTTLTGAVAATCTEAGYTGDLVCDDCAAIVTAGSVIAATGHTEVDIPAVAATCTEAGSSAGSYCSVCSEVLVAVTAVPATGHTEVEIPAVAATCTEAGSTAGSYCSVCSEVLVAVTAVPATGHTEVAIPAVAATCTEAGSTAGSYCSVCSEVLVAVTATPATGHTYTYVNNGDDHTVGCADCDYSATEAHSYEDGVCVCGAEEAVVDEYLDEGLTFYMRSLSFQSFIGMEYIFSTYVARNYDSYYIGISKDGGEEELPTGVPYPGAPSFLIYMTKIASPEMTCNISATVYAVKDGVVYHGPANQWSVRDAAMDHVNANASAQAVRFMVDMLNYGAESQLQFNRRTDDLANNRLTSAQQAMGTQENPTIAAQATDTDNGSNAVMFYTIAIGLESAINMQIIMYSTTYSAEEIELRVSYGDNTSTIDFEAIAGATGFLTAIYDGLTTPQQRQPVNITAYSKATGLPVSKTRTVSLESLLASMYSANPNLVNATMKYGDSAQAFFNYVVQ